MMIELPENIAALESYKPGKAVDNVFEGKDFKQTAILSSNENNLGTSPKAIAA
ncbi:MAG: histidinol-phosphate transaminase, partial [Thalassobius sp.]|nr:histidinol-phosphate transaminase [Thalassovita sp.]